MKRWWLVSLLLVPMLALAQSDPEFIPYDDPPPPPEPLPTREYDPGLIDDHLYPEASRSFSRLDDPNTGLGFAGVTGLVLGATAHRRGPDVRLTQSGRAHLGT